MDNPTTQAIATGRLKLRLIEARDLPALLPLHSDAELMRYRVSPAWKDLADGEKWLQRILAEQTAGTALQYVIEQRESAKVIGACVLFRWDKPSQRAEIGYALHQDYWGKGYMHEALQALIDHAFSQLDMRRLEADVDPRNHASTQSLVRLGFRHEGTQRERWIMHGEVADALLFGLLKRDWLAAQDQSLHEPPRWD